MTNCASVLNKILADDPLPHVPYMGALQWGTNLQGNDIANIDRPDVNTAGECSSQCLQHPQCLAMTFVKHATQPGGICWLKNAVSPASQASSMASAIKIFPQE